MENQKSMETQESSCSRPSNLEVDLGNCTAEETAANHPASMVTGILKYPVPNSLNSSAAVCRRIEGVSVLTFEDQSPKNMGLFKCENSEESSFPSPSQNQNVELETTQIPMQVSESTNVPFPRECTEGTDSHHRYVYWKKGRQVGWGSSGSCYIATIPATQSVVVVKQMSLTEKENAETEIDIMQSLHHQNIMQFHTATCDKDHFNIFMKWMPGGSLENKLKDGAFSEEIICKYSRQIICGLAYLHDSGIGHRDIKGANILLDSEGNTLRIADFGSAARLMENRKFHTVAGTPPFMAPEVARASDKRGYCLKCDVWSLGCVVIEMKTAKPPWLQNGQKYNRFSLLYKIGESSNPPPLPKILDSELKYLMVQCLQLNPDDRPSSSDLLWHHPLMAGYH